MVKSSIFGNAVVIKDNKITTIWDFRTDDTTYQPVLSALSAFIKSHAVSDIYVSKFKKIGTMPCEGRRTKSEKKKEVKR